MSYFLTESVTYCVQIQRTVEIVYSVTLERTKSVFVVHLKNDMHICRDYVLTLLKLRKM